MDIIGEYNQIGFEIVGSAFEVRKHTGRGLREKYYESALAWELRNKGFKVEQQVPRPAIYKGCQIDNSYTLDLLINEKIIIEVKAVSQMTDNERRQLLTYMKLSNCKLGYLINFGSESFSPGRFDENPPYLNGIYRLVNGL